VRQLALPAFTLRFRNAAGEEHAERVPGWGFSVAPLTAEPARDRHGDLRPDRAPEPVPTSGYELRLVLYGIGIAAAALYLLYLHVALRFFPRSNGPFARAYRELRRLARRRDEGEAYRSALRRLHRAFDETAGGALFAERLGEFFAARPRQLDLRPATERFFELSRQEFFAAGDIERSSLDWLIGFCRAWREHERGVA
jgi:mxaA protein